MADLTAELVNAGLCGNERMAELENAIRVLVDLPQGCTCPNNGAGDCEWCEAASIARDLL